MNSPRGLVTRQLRNNRHLQPRQTASQEGGKPIFESVQKMVALITGAAGIFVALLYVAGRSFASGYFAAMNIPDYHVNFSLWEYGWVSWLPLFLAPVVIILMSSLFGGISNRLLDLLMPLSIRLANWLRRRVTLHRLSLDIPEASRQTRLWFSIARAAFTTLLLLGIVIFTMYLVTLWGNLNGRTYVLYDASPVEIVSATPMAFGGVPASVQQLGNGEYAYLGLRVLTYNAGKYYFYKDIDAVTCRPSKVYVVAADKLLQVNLLPPTPISGTCR